MKMRQRRVRGNRMIWARYTWEEWWGERTITNSCSYWARYFDKTRIIDVDVAYSRKLRCTKHAAKKFNWKRVWE